MCIRERRIPEKMAQPGGTPLRRESIPAKVMPLHLERAPTQPMSGLANLIAGLNSVKVHGGTHPRLSMKPGPRSEPPAPEPAWPEFSSIQSRLVGESDWARASSVVALPSRTSCISAVSKV